MAASASSTEKIPDIYYEIAFRKRLSVIVLRLTKSSSSRLASELRSSAMIKDHEYETITAKGTATQRAFDLCTFILKKHGAFIRAFVDLLRKGHLDEQEMARKIENEANELYLNELHHRRRQSDMSDDDIWCDICRELPATYLCSDCKQRLCEKCRVQHKLHTKHLDDLSYDAPARHERQPISSEEYVAIADFLGVGESELSFRAGEIIRVTSRKPGVPGKEGWWLGEINGSRMGLGKNKGKVGIFPSPFVVPLGEPSTFKYSGYLLKIPNTSIEEGELLGEGCFGTVYRAKWNSSHPNSSLSVALKSIRGIPIDNSDFELEALMIATMNHKNVVRFWGLLDQGNLVLVMEYAAGGNLKKLIGDKRVTPMVIVDWAKQIASGMEHMHEQRLVHRDLKPDNILVLESIDSGDLSNKTIKIADFGYGLELSQSESMSGKGAPLYRAPEKNEVKFTSRLSDVWSYGLVLWQLLIGESVNYWEVTNDYHTADAVLKINLPITNFPPIFEQLIKNCLEIIYKKRPHFKEISEFLIQPEVTNFSSQDGEFFQEAQRCWKLEMKNIAQDHLDRERKRVKDSLAELKRLINDRKANSSDKLERLKKDRIIENFLRQREITYKRVFGTH